MTLEAEKPNIPVDKPAVNLAEVSVLEDLFYLGYANSGKITVYRDEEKNIEINVTFRTLTPAEIRDIFEASTRYDSIFGQGITEKLETLARAIKTINDMPLTLDSKERSEFHEQHDRDPTPLEQAKMILMGKVKSIHIIDALYEAYDEFTEEVSKHFNDVKKKLKDQTSSN